METVKTRCLGKENSRRPEAAFTLIEAIISMGILSFVLVALYGGIQTNMAMVRLCRENQAATQILTEKFEVIRLCNWTQVNSNGFIQSPFTVALNPGRSNSPPFFTGTVHVARAPFPAKYSNDIAKVTVRLEWMSGTRLTTRSMSTLAARHGLHGYVNH